MHEGEEDVLPNDEHIASMALHTQSLKVQVLETQGSSTAEVNFGSPLKN